MAERDTRLAHLTNSEDRQLGARILDVADWVYRHNQPGHTDFLDPRQQEIASGLVGGIEGLAYRFAGGYRRAERARMVIYPEFYLTETLEDPTTLLSVEGNFSSVDVSHRDFLGAILGIGLRREKIGDILVTEDGCQVVVAREVGPAVQQQLYSVHKVPVTVKEIDPEQLNIPPERVKEIKTTVASLRLDAVAASGFSTSRTRMTREIKAGKVKLNWEVTTNPAAAVEEGDVISIRGRGRVEVSELSGLTRKKRQKLVLRRLM